MKLLLTYEEIKELVEKCEHPIFKQGQEPDGEIAFMAIDDRRLHKLIGKAQLKKVVDYLYGNCDCPRNLPKPSASIPNPAINLVGKRYNCWKCRAKLKEVE